MDKSFVKKEKRNKKEAVPSSEDEDNELSYKKPKTSSSTDSDVFFKSKGQKKKERKRVCKTKKVGPKKAVTKCPGCQEYFKQILVHFSKKGKTCVEKCSKKEIEKFYEKSKETKRQKNKIRSAKYKEKQRQKDFEGFQRKRRDEFRKYRMKNPEKNKEKYKLLLQKFRNTDSSNERLRNFLRSTMYNAIFICICYNLRNFKSNVIEYSSQLKEQLSTKYPDIIKSCIGKNKNLVKFTTVNPREVQKSKYQENDKSIHSQYICNTCLKYMKRNKMPPMCWKNGLELYETVSEIKNQNLWLTEMEGAMIARKIIFMKIFLLPKSRWTALKDKAVNIPIPETAVLNTINSFPRTPSDAGLVAVSLKRKKEYKNIHKAQLVNPKKMFAVLDKLKKNQNPYFQFYDDYNIFEKRCLDNDPKGYEFTFGKSNFDDLEESLVSLMKNEDSDVSDEILSEREDKNDEEFEDEEFYAQKHDAARKYHFEYDKSLCFTDKYPEIAVAPGEGQKPKDLLRDKDWDIQAFPHLHNYDGSNGLHQNREVKLTNHQYFINRICHKDTRYSQSSAYLYSAVSFIEKNQIQRNYNLAGTTGIKTESSNGISYQLQDGYRVLKDIKGTPRYHLTGKHEMLSKLDNFGAFQFFFYFVMR